VPQVYGTRGRSSGHVLKLIFLAFHAVNISFFFDIVGHALWASLLHFLLPHFRAPIPDDVKLITKKL
jgi:hypothetical protein